MIPIEKNIIVVDESGKAYESTWLKRANGLVKKGRARWLNDFAICLARPPEHTEDCKMETINDTVKLLEDGTNKEVHNPVTDQNGLTLDDLLRRIDGIHAEMSYMQKLVENWRGDESVGIGNAVEEREKTYRQMLSFLEKIYTDRFAPVSEKDKTEARNAILDRMNEAIDNMSCRSVDGVNVVDAIAPILRFYGDLIEKL